MRFSRRSIVWLLGVWTLVAVSMLSGCGSSAKPESNVSGNRVGKSGDWTYNRIDVEGTECILASNQYDYNIGLSCDWASTPTTLPTPTTVPFGQ